MGEQEKNKLKIIRGAFAGTHAIFVEDAPEAVIEITFNPTEYSVDKRSSWASASIPGLDSPVIQFSSGDARILNLELLLDTYTYGNREDIRKKYIDKLEGLVLVDGTFHTPPPCKVIWGSLDFTGVVESLQKRYVMFLNDGTPVRARVQMSLKEIVPVHMQLMHAPRNSPDKTKRYTVKSGDSLWQLSYREYGDPKHWRIIADANNLDNPQLLPAGLTLHLPPLEQ